MAHHYLLFLLIAFASARPQSSDFEFGKLPESEEHFYQIERQDEQQYPNYDYDYVPEPVTKVGQGNVIEVLTQFKHDRFVNYLAKAGLAEDMKENGPYTIFVPSPSVFAQEGITEYFDSLSDEELTSLLLNHIVSGNMAVSEIEDGAVVNSVHGAELKFGVDPDDGHKFIGVEDGVAIIEDSDYQADNGLIHVTDWILFLPESGTESSSS